MRNQNTHMLRAWLKQIFISRPFARIISGQLISAAGSNATAVVIPLIAVITLQASSFEVGVLNAAQSIAAAILGIHIGRWCDQIGPDKTMLASNLIGMASTGLLCAGVFTGFISLPALIVLMLAVGIAQLGFDIARTGYTVALVPKEQLPHANSLIEGASAVGEGIGPSFGGWLFSSIGAAFALLFDCATYVCSSLLVLLNVCEYRQTFAQFDAQERAAADEDSGEGDNESLTEDIKSSKQGLRFAWKNGVIRSIACSAGQFNFFTAAFFTVYYVFVVRELHMSALTVGFAETCSGIAGIASAAVASPLMKHVAAGPLFLATMLGPTLAALLIPLAGFLLGNPPLVVLVVCVAQFAWSFTVTINLIVSESIKQMVTPEHMLGQVSSVERVIALAAEPIGALAGGAVAGLLGNGFALYLCVVGLATSILWALGKHGILSFVQPQEWGE